MTRFEHLKTFESLEDFAEVIWDLARKTEKPVFKTILASEISVDEMNLIKSAACAGTLPLSAAQLQEIEMSEDEYEDILQKVGLCRCPTCGRLAANEYKFCGYCGHSIAFD